MLNIPYLGLVPMNKTILGVSIAALFAVSVIGYAHAAVDWQDIVDGSVTTEAKVKNSRLGLTVTNPVDQQTDDLAGFAWFYNANPDSFTAFAITTHNAKVALEAKKNPARDSTQNPDGWHAHNVVLRNVAPGTFCVDDLSDAPTAGIAFGQDGSVKVNAPGKAIKSSFSGTAASFNIVPDFDQSICGPAGTTGSIVGLYVVVQDLV